MTTRPVLLYDGDCAFCTTCAQLVEKRIVPDAPLVPWQFADLTELGVTEAQAVEAVQWVGPDGAIRSGHWAVAAMLGGAGPFWRLAGHFLLLPGVSWIAAKVYALVAANRYRLPGSTPACKR